MKMGRHLCLQKINFVQLVFYLVSFLKLHGRLHMHACACIFLRVHINFYKIP